jgi:putative ABC transport system substrate-binding protein
MPVIGFLHSGSPKPNVNLATAFRSGLNETGYVDEKNVAIEFLWAEGRYDRLPELAADLVRRQVKVNYWWWSPCGSHHQGGNDHDTGRLCEWG